jgi:large subunit ribosomal protein L17
MRHRVAGRKLGLPSDQRRALLKGLVRSLLLHDKIVTTETRAKEIKPLAEQLVTVAKRGAADIHAQRLVRSYVDANVSAFARDEKGKLTANPDYAPARLFNEIAPRYANRPGGYTRITKIGARRGDGAPMVLLEFVEGEVVAGAAEQAPAAAPAKRRGLFGKK